MKRIGFVVMLLAGGVLGIAHAVDQPPTSGTQCRIDCFKQRSNCNATPSQCDAQEKKCKEECAKLDPPPIFVPNPGQGCPGCVLDPNPGGPILVPPGNGTNGGN